ncbi:sugar phosphate isomerase/epimerase family protein [Spongisporangium articulatum]|uniref:Sugar phosphate isomerase/epimerase family protein n=1 Tax=Spongisporangium articulatum TaxID=3362603 RepID=A0ABW8AQH3_9ACTN
MRASIATTTLGGSIEQKLDAAAAAGFDAIEIFGTDLDGAASTPKEIGARAADLGLSLDLYQPVRDVEGTPAELFGATLDRVERTCDLMADLGIDTMLVCSNTAEWALDDESLAAAQLVEVADRAALRGFRVVYEAMSWGRHVRDYQQADRIVARAAHPQLGLCLDSFHIFARRNDLADIATIPGERIFAVQLADAVPQGDRPLIEWSRHHRCLPPNGYFALEDLLRLVAGTGYAGPLSLEIFSDELRAADPFAVARDARRSLAGLAATFAAARPEVRREVRREVGADGRPDVRTAGLESPGEPATVVPG